MVITTIQVSQELVEELKIRKIYNKESYEDIIRDLLEDSKEINEETKKDIERGFADIKSGKTISFGAIKKKYNLR